MLEEIVLQPPSPTQISHEIEPPSPCLRNSQLSAHAVLTLTECHDSSQLGIELGTEAPVRPQVVMVMGWTTIVTQIRCCAMYKMDAVPLNDRTESKSRQSRGGGEGDAGRLPDRLPCHAACPTPFTALSGATQSQPRLPAMFSKLSPLQQHVHNFEIYKTCCEKPWVLESRKKYNLQHFTQLQILPLFLLFQLLPLPCCSSPSSSIFYSNFFSARHHCA